MEITMFTLVNLTKVRTVHRMTTQNECNYGSKVVPDHAITGSCT